MTEFEFELEDSSGSKQTPNIIKLSPGVQSKDKGTITVTSGSEKVIINFEARMNITSVNLTISNSNHVSTNAALTEMFVDFQRGKY